MYYAETRFLPKLGEFSYEMYLCNKFFSVDKQCGHWYNLPLKRFKVRMPLITIPLHHMCKGFFKFTYAGRKRQVNSWIKVQQSSVQFSSLFANDGLIFSRASTAECRNLKKVFDVYAAASGQIFNYEKFSMFFSSNTDRWQMKEIKSIFNLNVVSKHEKYLGLPSMVGRRKISFFNDIKLRVLSKLTSWQNKFFSCGGNEVLIKVVAQAVPGYAMSVFKMPLSICEDIQKVIARFWWGGSEDHMSIHWVR